MSGTGMFGVSGTGDTSGYGGLVRPVAMPGGSARPYGGWFDEVADALDTAALEGHGELRAAVEKVVVPPRRDHLPHPPRATCSTVAGLLRDDAALRFEMCTGVSGVHYPDDAGRELHAVYHLLSMTHNRRIRLEVTCPDADPHIPSVVVASTPPPTGTSARPGTSSASSSTATRR